MKKRFNCDKSRINVLWQFSAKFTDGKPYTMTVKEMKTLHTAYLNMRKKEVKVFDHHGLLCQDHYLNSATTV